MPSSQIASRRFRSLRGRWPWLVVLLPALLYLAFLPHFGALQNNDYFGSILTYLGTEGGFAAHAERYVQARSNEHRIALPMLVYDLNYRLSRGSNRPLSALAVALMGIVFVLLYRLLPLAARQPPVHQAAFGLLVAAFVFTPVAAHNVAMGFSGIMWFMSNVMFISALVVLVRRGPEGGLAALWPIAFFGALGLFSYSTSLSMWPALVVAALCLRLGWRKITLLTAFAILAYGYYFATYATMRGQPGPNTDDPGAALAFFGIYLGGIFTRDTALATWIGWGGALLALALVVFVLVRRRALLPRLAPWLAIQAFGVSNAAGTAIGRSNFGDQMAVSSRYATLPGFFWAGLLLSAAVLSLERALAARRRRVALCAVFAVFLALAVPMYVRGVALLEAFANRALFQRLAELALVRGYYDSYAMHAVTPVVEEFWRARGPLIRLGHHPFDRPHPPPADSAIAPRAAKPHPALRGAMTGVSRTEDGTLRPVGWSLAERAHGDGPGIEAMAVVDAAGRPVGELILGLPTPAEARRAGVQDPHTGWAGYARGVAPEGLRIYARLSGDPRWYPLPGE